MLVGEVDEIVDQVRACRERLGVSYFVVHEHNIETFAPVLNGLSGQ